MMVQLDDVGIDFTDLTDYDLFLLTFENLKHTDTSLVFPDLDLTGFKISPNEKKDGIILRDEQNDITIDRAVYFNICEAIRRINYLEKPKQKPANDEAKKYMIERARIKQKRAAKRRKKEASVLENYIISLVNTEEFKYDYSTVRDLTLYQFNSSLRQIVHKINYNNTMIGCYAGTVNAKDLSQDNLTWIRTEK